MNATMLNGEKVRKWMISTRISTNTLAAKLNVSPSMVRQMLGGYQPRRSGEVVVAALAKLMKVSPSSLFVGHR